MDFLTQLSFWHWQVILFAIMLLAFSIIYYRRFRAFINTTDHPTLNNRTARMHGTRFVLASDLLGGEGAQQISRQLLTRLGRPGVMQYSFFC